MKYLKKYPLITKTNESSYSGTIKGYEITISKTGEKIKTTTGLRNIFPIPCKVYIKEGKAIAFYKGGVLFSDTKTQDSWKKEFGSIENDPRFVEFKENVVSLNEIEPMNKDIENNSDSIKKESDANFDTNKLGILNSAENFLAYVKSGAVGNYDDQKDYTQTSQEEV